MQHHRYNSRPPIKFWNIDTQFGRAVTILIIHPIYPQYSLLIPQINVSSETHSSSSCINLASHLHYSLVLTFTPTSTSSQPGPGESMIFQPVLQAYPTRQSWIITAHISLGNLECHFRNTFTTCITCCRPTENATAHC